MRFKSSLAAVIVIVLAAATPVAQAAATAPFTNENGEPTLAPVIEEIAPAIVNIATRGMVEQQQNPLFENPLFENLLPQLPGGDQQQQMVPAHSVGSGVIVDAENGYILTNHHVIAHADEVMVTLTDRRQLPAELVGSDPETDIAVLKVEADNLTAIELGDSEGLRVGDFVVAVGNPFGLGQTVTLGIVSAVGRSGLGIEGYEDFIQTDASINPGNSGGALVTLSGKVVGINTAILGSTGNIGIGFAIPVNMASAVMEQIVEHGSVQRGLLGVNIQDLTPELAEALGVDVTEGAVVSRVFPDSGAAAAGIEDGDIITEVNGTKVENASDLRNTVGLMRIGEDARLTILRGGERLEVSATIQPRPEETAAASAVPQDDQAVSANTSEFAGAFFGPIDPASEFAEELDGVQVMDVQPNSRAWAAGLRPGDVVTEVNRSPVGGTQEFAAAVEDAEDKVLLHVRRGSSAFYVLI